jgi:hypothetical protein
MLDGRTDAKRFLYMCRARRRTLMMECLIGF